MAVTDQLKSLVEQMPAPDGRGMYTEEIDDEKIKTAIGAIASGGNGNLLGLIEMLGEPGSEENAKPHYALHCVMNYALITHDDQLRTGFCEVLGSQLQNQSLHPINRAYLCQELQWAGGDEACPALGKVLLDEELTDAAATALASIGGERAASQLRQAAEQAKGKARRNLMDALAALAEPHSAATFQEALTDEDREVRIAAAIGLAKLGKADASGPLLKLAEEAEGWERTQTTKACLVLAEQLAAIGNTSAAKRVYEQLQKSRTNDSERHIRDAAQRGLAAIA